MLDGVAHSLPGLQRHGSQESELFDGLLRVGHSAPDRNAAFDRTAQSPQWRADDCRQSDVNGHVPNRSAIGGDGPA